MQRRTCEQPLSRVRAADPGKAGLCCPTKVRDSMPSNRDSGRSPFEGVVRDTLDAVLPEDVRDAILTAALRRTGYAMVPTDRSALAAFVEGPLREVSGAALGPALAGTITEEILRALARPTPRSAKPPPMQTQRAARRRASSIPSLPTGPESDIRPNSQARDTDPDDLVAARRVGRPMAPLVLVATEEALLFETLAEWFDHRARVERALNATELVERLVAAASRRAVVVLDGKRPSIPPSELLRLMKDLPDVEVVLCRAARALEEAVVSALPAGSPWVVYPEPASLDHVAAECLRLVS